MLGLPIMSAYVRDTIGPEALETSPAIVMAGAMMLYDPLEAKKFEKYVDEIIKKMPPATTETEKNKRKFLKAALIANPLERAKALSTEFPETFGKAYEEGGLNAILAEAEPKGGLKAFVGGTEPKNSKLEETKNADEKTRVINKGQIVKNCGTSAARVGAGI